MLKRAVLLNVTMYIYSFLGIKKNGRVSILDGRISNSTSIPPCNCIEYCERNGGSFETGSKGRKQGANTKVLWNSYKARRHEYQREACRISRPHPPAVPADFLRLSVFSSSFLSSLLHSAELSRFTRRKATPRRILNTAVGHACRRLHLYSHTQILFSLLAKRFFFPRIEERINFNFCQKKISLYT